MKKYPYFHLPTISFPHDLYNMQRLENAAEFVSLGLQYKTSLQRLETISKAFTVQCIEITLGRGCASKCHCGQADTGRISRIFGNIFRDWWK